ncbi:MAG: sigma 54-interacting transcriptional regulator [Firmicutes bacterium]|nr:sigma 54-interacting transcriptional regulator [Bacillota bacterium]
MVRIHTIPWEVSPLKAEYYEKIIYELINLVDEGIYIVDKDGLGAFYNHTMADLEKVNVEDVLGKKFHEAFPDFNLEDSTMFKALKKRESTVRQQQTYKNLYGKEITTINSTIPVIVGGETVAAIEVAKDITDIRQMSDKLMELREGVARRNRRKSDEPPSGEDDNGNSKTATEGPKGIRRYSFEDIWGESPEIKEVVERAKRAAAIDASVFIYGETGTGKELFAQSIHYGGIRKDKPFLAQNCAAIPEPLLEGMLFGTAKGGFTGAVDRAGLFEQASGGTLLLDEISAMPYDLQSKLLRVLQENYIRRVGGAKDIPVDVRIIATVNEAPEDLMVQGKLRKDLYYRLNVVNISIPPLRERQDDILVLAERFLEKHNQRFHKEIWMITDGAGKKLRSHDYPGNVRELENIIEQAVSMADHDHVLTEKLLSMPGSSKKSRGVVSKYVVNEPLHEYMETIEGQIIKEAIINAGGNISKAAEALQMKRQTLQHKLKKYKIMG